MKRICDKCLGEMDRNGTGKCFDCWRNSFIIVMKCKTCRYYDLNVKICPKCKTDLIIGRIYK